MTNTTHPYGDRRAASPLRCRHCQGTVTLPDREQAERLAAIGGRLLCDDCGADLGPATRALAYLGRRETQAGTDRE